MDKNPMPGQTVSVVLSSALLKGPLVVWDSSREKPRSRVGGGSSPPVLGPRAGIRDKVTSSWSRRIHPTVFTSPYQQIGFKSLYLETNRKCVLVVNNLSSYSCQLLRDTCKKKKKIRWHLVSTDTL